MDYAELYDALRKEKYAEQLVVLPKSFIDDVATLLKDLRTRAGAFSDTLSDDVLKLKKQYENAMSLFKELMLRRKKKILNLVFVASETGVMKRDVSMMLGFEQALFERLVQAVEHGDKALGQQLAGTAQQVSVHRLIQVHEPVNEFVGAGGDLVGPFVKGELANVAAPLAELLVSDGRARFVDAGS